jgi:hypothetical protein
VFDHKYLKEYDADGVVCGLANEMIKQPQGKSHHRTSMRASNRDLRFSARRSQGCGLLDSWPHAHFVETNSEPQRTLIPIGRLDNAVTVA